MTTITVNRRWVIEDDKLGFVDVERREADFYLLEFHAELLGVEYGGQQFISAEAIKAGPPDLMTWAEENGIAEMEHAMDEALAG